MKTEEQTCVLWQAYASPQEAYEDARLVVVGTSAAASDSASMFGITVPLHEIDVQEVLKGTLPDDPLLVAPAPITCTEPDDIGPDPLDTDETLILMLEKTEGTWRPLTPFDGVLVLPPDGTLPFRP